MLSKRERSLLAVFLLLTAAIIITAGGRHVFTRLNTRRLQLTSARQQTALYQNTIAEADSIARQLEILTEQKQNRQNLQPTAADPYTFGLEVDAVFGRFPLTVQRYRIMEASQNSRPGVQAELSGTMPELLALLRYIETERPGWYLPSLTISNEGTQQTKPHHRMSIRIAYETQ